MEKNMVILTSVEKEYGESNQNKGQIAGQNEIIKGQQQMLAYKRAEALF